MIIIKKISFTLFLLCLFSNSALASVIMQIEFVGNDKTRDIVLLQEMQSKIGDKLDIRLVKEDVQAIMDLSLFRSVDYYLYAADDYVQDHVKLVIHVREKYFVFVLPDLRFDEEEKEMRFGVRAYWDNINGNNHSLRFKAREHGEELGVRDVRKSLTYAWPRINGSPYRLELFNSTRDAIDTTNEVIPQLRDELKYGFDLFRWYHLDNRSSGWYSGVGLYREERNNEAFNSGDVSKNDFQGSFWGFRFGYKKVNNYLFNRRGKDFGYRLDTTRLLFESDENYTRHLLFYRSYYRLKSYPLNNLNVQLQLGVSEGDYLGDVEYSLGGKTLRGYEKGEYTGNAMVLMNLEYLVPMSDNPAYRYGLLFDIGNTYERFEDIDLGHLHPAIGFGFRWKLAAFVKVNIRLDFGYAIDTGDTNILLNSRHLF